MAIAILLRDLRKSNPNIQVAEVSNFPGYAVDSDGGVWTCRRLGKNGGSPRMTNHWRKVTQRDDKDGYSDEAWELLERMFKRPS
jgi:tRNA(Ile)-lysidine synthase TilS/MesJ